MTNIPASLDGWQFAKQLAQREIRGSLRKFRVFLGALLVGVAAIGTVGGLLLSLCEMGSMTMLGFCLAVT